MKNSLPYSRGVAILMLGALATSSLAPAAEAGTVRRWKGSIAGYQVESAPRVTYVHRSSNAAPLVAGLIGGVILGTALSNAHSAVDVGYSYYDPYREVRYSSLDAYDHFDSYGYPQLVQVFRGGDRVRQVYWNNGGWRDYHGDWRAYRGWQGNRGWHRGGRWGGGYGYRSEGWQNDGGAYRNDGGQRYRDDGRRGENWRDRSDWRDGGGRDRGDWQNRGDSQDRNDEGDGR